MGSASLWETVGGTTNDLGEFRLFGLSPGQYIVQATLRAVRFENLKTKQGYMPIYYPGVPDAEPRRPHCGPRGR